MADLRTDDPQGSSPVPVSSAGGASRLLTEQDAERESALDDIESKIRKAVDRPLSLAERNWALEALAHVRAALVARDAERELCEAECRKYGIEPARLDLLLRHLDGNFRATYGAKDWMIQKLKKSCLLRDEELVGTQAELAARDAELAEARAENEEQATALMNAEARMFTAEAEVTRLRAVLHEARPYVKWAEVDRSLDVAAAREVLAHIDAALAGVVPPEQAPRKTDFGDEPGSSVVEEDQP